jgi:hypothetical protein
MLNAISWQQYLTAVILITAAWYAYVGLRHYRPEISSFLKIKSQPRTLTPPLAKESPAVMGEVKPDPDTGLYDAENLIFSSSEPDDISDHTLPKGPGDDLLAEAQVLVTAYEDNEDKNEFLSFLQLLIKKYEVFSDEISLPNVIASLKPFAEVRLPFRLQETEWPLNF